MEGYEVRTKGIAERVRNITISAIKEMMVLGAQYEDVISFGQGTPSFRTSAHIRERIKRELDENPDIGKYTPMNGYKELRLAAAEALRRKRGIEADANREIYITSGAMEAISSAVMTVVDPGDEVILPSPCFPSHIEQITLAGGKPVFVPLIEEEGWRLDIDVFQKVVTPKTKAMIITNPTNPTGTLFSEKEQRELARFALKNDIIVITDEPYDFLVYDGRAFFSLTNIPELKENRISCFSFSKEYAITGFRVGYVYAEEGFINQMLKVHDAVAVCASSVSQYGAMSALTGSQECVNEFASNFAKRRDLICSWFDKMPDLFSYQKPQGAYYIFPKVIPPIDSFEFCIKLLKEAKVILIPGEAFGPTGTGHVRFSYACSEEDIERGMRRIAEWWEKNKQLKK